MEVILIIGAFFAVCFFFGNLILNANERADKQKRLIAEQEITRIDNYKIDPKLIPRYLIIAYHKEIQKRWFETLIKPDKSNRILESIKKIDKIMYYLINPPLAINNSKFIREAKKEIIDYNLHDLDIEHVDWSRLGKIKVSFHDNGNLKSRSLWSRNYNISYTCEWYDNGKIKNKFNRDKFCWFLY